MDTPSMVIGTNMSIRLSKPFSLTVVVKLVSSRLKFQTKIGDKP